MYMANQHKVMYVNFLDTWYMDNHAQQSLQKNKQSLCGLWKY